MYTLMPANVKLPVRRHGVQEGVGVSISSSEKGDKRMRWSKTTGLVELQHGPGAPAPGGPFNDYCWHFVRAAIRAGTPR